MSELPRNDGTVELPPPDGADSVCMRFENAWQAALVGGNPPDIELFLQDLPAPDQLRIRFQLEQIRMEYMSRMRGKGRAPDASLETTPNSTSATINIRPGAPAQKPVPAHDATMEGIAPPEARADATLSEAELRAGLAGTIDPSAQDQRFSLNEAVNTSPFGATLEYPGGAPPVAPTMDSESDAPPVATEPADGKTRLPKRVGDYEILGKIGEGGMGVVYKGRHRKLNRIAAIKMIIGGEHVSEQQLRRFKIEAEAIARLQHPNIVGVFDSGEQDGQHYFALEFVDGGSLSQKLGGQPMDPIESARIVETLANAMHYAHQANIIHRDLKPANILLTRDGAPKVTDFGLAKKLEEDRDSSQTRTGTLMGTPSYMAPEQAQGRVHEMGPPVDQYALGAILYEMLTGRPPFLAATPMDTIMQVLKEEATPPSKLQPGVPPALEIICMRALQKEPHKRYANCHEFAADLRRFRAGEEIQAKPIGDLEKLWRWCRRNPKIAGLTATILVLLIVGLAYATWSAYTISLARDAAEVARDKAEKAQVAEAAARKEAEENEKLAHQQTNLAVQSLFTLGNEVQSKLRDKPDMDDLRQALLDTAMSGMDKVAERGAKSALALRTKGGVHQRKGDLFLRLAKSEEAKKEYALGAAVFDEMIKLLPATDPESEVGKYNLAILYDKLGAVTPQLPGGTAQQALDYYDKALKLRLELASAKLQNELLTPQRIRQALADSYQKLGNATLMEGKPRRARDYFLKALEPLEAAWKGTPTNPQTMGPLASVYNTVGDVSLKLGEPEAARKYFTQALDMREQIAKANPKSPQARLELASSKGLLGDLDLLLRKPKEALPYYLESHQLFAGLANQDKKNAVLQGQLGTSHYKLGCAYLALGNKPEAAKEFNEAVAIRTKLAEADAKNGFKQIELILALARAGDHAQAAKRADELVQAGAKDPGILFYIACGYALCTGGGESPTLRQEYLHKAVAMLKKAIEQGYNDLGTLELDPDLDPIRDQPEYKALLAELKEKQKAAAAAAAP